MPNVYAPALFRPKVKWRTKARDAYFRENQGIDPAILAMDLHLSENFVITYLRKMGLRQPRTRPQARYRWGGNPIVRGGRHGASQ
jgi:hypothetical protein